MQAILSRLSSIFSRGNSETFHLWAFWRFFWAAPNNAPARAEMFLKLGRLYFLKQPIDSWRRGRFTDDDIVIGPLTVAKVKWDTTSLTLRGSVTEDDKPYCSLTWYGFGFGFRLFLPAFIKPVMEKVCAKSWDAETIKRLGRDWYPQYHAREYGFSLHDGHFAIYYGMQNRNGWGGKLINRRWSCFLPWTQMRFVRHRLFDAEGNLFYEWKAAKGKKRSDEIDEKKREVTAQYFLIRDYDGARIVAKTVMEERMWLKGEKWCSWLSWFTKPFVRRVIDIQFSQEVGTAKGSWKGGLIGTSIDIAEGETHADGFIRYCFKEYSSKEGRYRIEFIRPVHPDELILLVPAKCSW